MHAFASEAPAVAVDDADDDDAAASDGDAGGAAAASGGVPSVVTMAHAQQKAPRQGRHIGVCSHGWSASSLVGLTSPHEAHTPCAPSNADPFGVDSHSVVTHASHRHHAFFTDSVWPLGTSAGL